MKHLLTLALLLVCFSAMAQRATTVVIDCIDPVNKIVLVSFGNDEPRESYLYNLPRNARFKRKAKSKLMKQARMYKRIERTYR